MNVHVFLNHCGRRRLAGLLTRGTRGILFEYHPDFLQSGIQLSPFMLPLQPGIFFDEKQTFDGLYGLFNDSLPDGWGLLLIDRALRRLGRSLAEVSPLERLMLAGRNGMGALEYEPDTSPAHTDETLADIDSLAKESARLLGERDYAGEHLDELFRLSGSLAGARPKVCCMLPDSTGTPCPWIVKFPALQDPPDIGMLEYQYNEAARLAGIDVPETRLLSSGRGAGYFASKRFDRKNGLKVHTHTACGLLHASHRYPSLDYENLIRLTLHLTRNKKDVENMVRLMVFNVKAGNRDDHSKNFSFCMDEDYCWHLAPAYDLTCSAGLNGEHCMAVNSRGRGITDSDLVSAAAPGGIPARKVREIIGQVKEALFQVFGKDIRLPLSVH